MVVEDDTFVIHGPEPLVPIPDGLLGNFIYESLVTNDEKFECMVDAFTSERRSYESILEDSCNLAQALRNYGMDSNTIVSIIGENSLRWFDPVFASLYLGATVAPINHTYVEDELRHFLSMYQPKLLFCSRATVEKILLLKLEFEFLEKIILIQGDEVFGVENITSFIRKHLGTSQVDPKTFKPYNEADPVDHVAFILGSSGTTGLPKGVMLTDRNLLVRVAQSRDPRYTIGPTSGNTVLGLMPFFHGFGLNVTINSIVDKHRVAVFKNFDEDVFLKTIQDYKISVLGMAPPLAVFLAKSPKVDKYDLSSVQEIICGAAPMSKDIEHELKKRLNLKSTRQAYGLTEANLAVTSMKKGDTDRQGSSGTVITYMSIKIRNPETGKSLGPNQIGEICIKGPLLMKGYFKNPEATRESFTSDGWLLSGDLGYYDNDGFFFIVDRLKELIKYKGFQVAPAELEAILLNHPKVLDVGVVGAPDELAGELPLAFVAKKPGVDVTEKELQDFVAKKVSPQKRLRGGIYFVNAIPKNASGKILRRELRQQIAAYVVKQDSKL